jgi:hypothetical protein
MTKLRRVSGNILLIIMPMLLIAIVSMIRTKNMISPPVWLGCSDFSSVVAISDTAVHHRNNGDE